MAHTVTPEHDARLRACEAATRAREAAEDGMREACQRANRTKSALDAEAARKAAAEWVRTKDAETRAYAAYYLADI